MHAARRPFGMEFWLHVPLEPHVELPDLQRYRHERQRSDVVLLRAVRVRILSCYSASSQLLSY